MQAPAVVTGLFSIGSKLIDHWFPDADEADKRKTELLTNIQNGNMKEVEEAASVIRAEANSEHFLVAAWRPITMLTFVFIIANNYILYPYLALFFEQAPKLEIPPDMWGLLKIGLGGYVVGRSGEKIAQVYKDKKG